MRPDHFSTQELTDHKITPNGSSQVTHQWMSFNNAIWRKREKIARGRPGDFLHRLLRSRK
jgi:hypothetical protein